MKATGSVLKHPLLVLVFSRNDISHSRTAVVASKSTGNAVTRNRIKRRMRACLDAIWVDISPSWDMIFYARTRSTEATFLELQDCMRNMLKRAGILMKDNNNVSK